MFTALGPLAELANTLAEYFLSPEGFAAFKRRRALATLKKDAVNALHAHDFDAVEQHLNQLRELANKP